MVPSFSGSLSVALPSSPCLLPRIFLPYISLPLGIFWLNWMDRDLGTYQLAMMSCLFFFFFFWPCFVAYELLVPQPGMEPRPPALNHQGSSKTLS